MKYVIELIEFAGIPGPRYQHVQEGALLKSFDADAHDGRGDAVWTMDVVAAMKFDTKAEAMTCWRTQSTVRPWRPDGKPNRPLTAATISISEFDGCALCGADAGDEHDRECVDWDLPSNYSPPDLSGYDPVQHQSSLDAERPGR